MAAYTLSMPIDEMLRLRYDELQPMSQTEAGAACGVGQSSFNRWLRGKSAPKPEHIDGVARFLDADVPIVLNGIQLLRVRDRLGDPSGAIAYLTDQLIKFQAFVPEEKRQEADEVIAGIVEWLPTALEDAAQSRFALAADTGNEPAKRGPKQKRPSPPAEPEGA